MEPTIVRLLPVGDGVDIQVTPGEAVAAASRTLSGDPCTFVLSSWAKRIAPSMRVSAPSRLLAS